MLQIANSLVLASAIQGDAYNCNILDLSRQDDTLYYLLFVCKHRRHVGAVRRTLRVCFHSFVADLSLVTSTNHSLNLWLIESRKSCVFHYNSNQTKFRNSAKWNRDRSRKLPAYPSLIKIIIFLTLESPCLAPLLVSFKVWVLAFSIASPILVPPLDENLEREAYTVRRPLT